MQYGGRGVGRGGGAGEGERGVMEERESARERERGGREGEIRLIGRERRAREEGGDRERLLGGGGGWRRRGGRAKEEEEREGGWGGEISATCHTAVDVVLEHTMRMHRCVIMTHAFVSRPHVSA